MIEKGLNPYRAYIRQRLCTLFLFTAFISPERIQREISKYLELPSENIRLNKEVERVQKKLSNEGFVKKAPEKVIEEERAKEKDYSEKRDAVIRRIEELKQI